MVRIALIALALAATLPDSSVKWDGMFHVRVRCAAATACKGHISVRAPGADPSNTFAEQDYSVAAGTTNTIDLDPAGADNSQIDKLSSVVVRLDDVDKTMTLDKGSFSPAPRPLGPPTRSQHVIDRRGDSHDGFGMDLVYASATRKGRAVVFVIRTAKPPPNQRDFAGNPTAPCLEIARSGPHAIQTCGDAQLRGYTMNNWPKVPFSLRGSTARWTVPLKYLPKRSFKWRAYVMQASHPARFADLAPNKGYLTFIR